MPILVALAIAVFAVGVDNYIVAAMLPAISNDLGAPVGQVGIIASAYALPTALLAPAFGPFSDRRGRRAALLLGLSVFAIGSVACVASPSLPLLVVARVITGLGAAIIVPAAFAAASDQGTPAERSRAISIVAAMYPLSTLLGLPVGAVAGILLGWRAAFALILVLGLVAFALVAWRLRDMAARPRPEGSYLDTYRVLATERRVLPVLAVTACWFLATFGSFLYLTEFVHERFGVPADQASLLLIVLGVMGTIATRVSQPLMVAIGARRTVLLAIAMFVVAAFLMPAAPILPLAVVVFGIWTFGTWIGVPASQTIVAGLSETRRGTLLSFNSSAMNLAFVISPLIIGRLIDAGGFDLSFRVSAGIGVVALVLAWAFLPRTAAIVPVPEAAA
jgi:DHA1 family inner membrane transport protein